jgi:peptidoglycan hydrolase FlgJ
VMSSKKGIGLAEVLERHLTRQSAEPSGGDEPMLLNPLPRAFDLLRARAILNPGASAATGAVPSAPSFDALGGMEGADAIPGPQARDFVNRVLPDAQVAAREIGIPAGFLIAHAALETGWGRSEPRGADGRPSHNLFGIKAGRNWTGDSVESATTEYVQGLPQRRLERFRAYGSYAESFRDYAGLLTASPRYADVVGAQDPGRFARGLQAAGYATDPAYAAKLQRVIGTLPPSLLASG